MRNKIKSQNFLKATIHAKNNVGITALSLCKSMKYFFYLHLFELHSKRGAVVTSIW